MRICEADALHYLRGHADCKGIVNLALKVGLSRYRFVEYNITPDEQIAWSSNRYVTLNQHTVNLANSFIRKRPKILEIPYCRVQSEEEFYSPKINNQLGHSLNSECPSLFWRYKTWMPTN